MPEVPQDDDGPDDVRAARRAQHNVLVVTAAQAAIRGRVDRQTVLAALADGRSERTRRLTKA